MVSKELLEAFIRETNQGLRFTVWALDRQKEDGNKKYPSCDAQVGYWCSRHQCVHKIEDSV